MASVLTSWKEISDHLGKGVRTVQRWEAELGLPVHRSDAKLPRAIFALPEELDAWARSHPLAPAAAVVDSLYREIASLRELVCALSERLDTLERARLASPSPISPDGAAWSRTLLLRQDLRQIRVALHAAIDRSQYLRGQREAARELSKAACEPNQPFSAGPRPDYAMQTTGSSRAPRRPVPS